MLSVPTFLAAILLTNATDVTVATLQGRIGTPFDLQGMVVSPTVPQKFTFVLLHADQGTIILDKTGTKKCLSLVPGDIVRTSGTIIYSQSGRPIAGCQTIDVLAHEDPPEPLPVTIAEIKSGRFDHRPIRTRGTVREVFRDEIDPEWIYITLSDRDQQLYLTLRDQDRLHDNLKSITGAEVAVDGICALQSTGRRRILGRTLAIYFAKSIRVVRAPPDDPFDVPDIASDISATPEAVIAMGRRRVVGCVIAVRHNGSFLLRDVAGEPRTVTPSRRPPPACGEWIEAAGIPWTDLYRINLSDATWRPIAGMPAGDASPPIDVDVAEMLTDDSGANAINPRWHGKTVRLRGTVLELSPTPGHPGIATLKSGTSTFRIEQGPENAVWGALSEGCRVEVTGVCVVETENWLPYAAFPHTKGITLVVRSPKDVRILAQPPWWTPQRLAAVIALLVALLVGILLWNRILQRIIVRKSRQLAREQLAQMRSELRVAERTNLAVELHDSLSQNLSGVACQIDATRNALALGSDKTAKHLNTASRMLLSCRTELRRCLWDLRGDALEDRDFSEAIRKSLAPVTIGAELSVRFNVRRPSVSDTVTHAIICIVRELAANAVRHGKAHHVRVAGERHGDRLSFSVRDDGQGFDPATAADAAEGHFGLEGIRERVKRLNGSFTIDSSPDTGTRAVVELTAHEPNGEEEADS